MSRRASLISVLSFWLVMFGLYSTAAFGQCTLSGPLSTWNAGTGNWSNGSDWTGGVPNSSTQSVCITNGTMGAPSVVNLDINASVNNLQLGSFDTLNFNPGTQLQVSGTQIINAGQININSGGGQNALLELANNVTLSGAGTLTLSNSGGAGAAIIYQATAGLTLTNQSTIQGAGTIGFNGLSLINQGTVDANTSGQTLQLASMSNGINNAGGLLSATNGGILNIDGVTVAGGGTITANTGGTVQLVGNTAIQGAVLNNVGGTLGTLSGNSAFLDGSTAAGAITINGTYTNGVGSNTYILGTINNKNNFQLNAGGGSNSELLVDSSNLTLQGGGTVTLSNSGGGGSALLVQAVGGLTLTNVDNTIQGAGIIGFNGLSVVNEATINANVSGQTLTLDSMSNGLNNTGGTLEASNGGTLYIDGVTVNNTGAHITANAGSTVQLVANTTIQGGTLTNNGAFLGTPDGNSAILDGSTAAGAITINGTYTNGVGSNTYILGTINNKNNFQLNAGGGSNSELLVDSSNLTLQGGGTVTLSNSGGGGSALLVQAVGGLTLTNVNNTIQGTGVIGFNGLTVVNEATIDANVSSQTLTLDSMSGGLTNTAMVEASNGGTLLIDGVTVNNAGGGITANAGSTVQLVANTTIQGGTLTNNGVFFGTPDGNSAILDGSTAAGAITINGTYTNGNGSNTYLLGTINNNNNFLVTAAGNGSNSELLIDSSNVMLQGGGTLTLSTASGGGDALLVQAAGGLTLTNVNNTIQGEGIIGFNGLTLVNEAGGTINANSMGGSLINALTIDSASVTNQGLMEATNNGVLNIDGITVQNQGGTIAANGSGASVQLYGNAIIQGGTLTNNGGAFFGTPNGNTATLDGSTSQGQVTINGTYTNGNNGTTLLLGTINNQGNILLNGGSGNNSDLEIDSGNVTLKGGGTVTLSTAGGGGNAIIFQAAGGLTLENFNNTIQGAGIIGDNGLSLLNDAAGTILANAPGQTLTINGGGTVTNNGTFQADAGSTLHLLSVAFTNFAGNTLTGGTYNVYGTLANPGTLQINPLGSTGGEIVNNAATILLDGPNSNFVDSAGLDALSNFSNNEAAGSFTIQNGRNFTGPTNVSFANAGAVNIGTNSTFTTGGTGNYNQSGGSTKLDGSLVAGGGQANFNGGSLYGNGGTITGNVMMAGTIGPGDILGTAGTLNIHGNYTQTAAGIFDLGIGGISPGTQFGLLNITGSALINGTLNVALLNGYLPSAGNTFTFIDAGSVSGEFADVNGLNIGHGLELSVIYGSDFVELAVEALSTTDLWLGGADNWSNGAKWSIGVPQPVDDVIIYSGGNDVVTLNTPGNNNINSLGVGGATNGFTSELTDGGVARTLTIANGLTVGQQGILDFTGNGSNITAATVTNDGSVTIGHGATLNLTNQPNGVTDVAAGASWTIGGNFSVGGVANTGFANLASIEGSVELQNGQSQTIGNALTVASTGSLDVSNGTTLNITGNVTDNSTGFGHGIYTSFNGGSGGDTLAISGMLTNSGAFELLGSGDKASIGNGVLNNVGGLINAANGSALNITGDVTNNGTLASTFFSSQTGGSTLNITGNLTNNGGFGWLGAGDLGGVTGNVINNSGFTVLGSDAHTIGGTLTNNAGGFLDIDNQSTLHVTGNVTNFGGPFGTAGIYVAAGNFGSTLTIGGSLTNDGTFFVGALAMGSIANGVINNADGLIDVEQGGTLAITGAVGNSGTIQTNFAGAGGGNTITISGLLTNTGTLQLLGPGDMATLGSLTNNAGVDVEGGSTLTVTGNVINSASGSEVVLIALTGGSQATFEDGLTNNVAPVDLENASKLTIDGDVSNSGTLSLSGFGGTGGNTLTITGMLTNNQNLELFGSGDMAEVATLTNNVNITVETGATLNLTGQPSGITDAVAGSDFELYGSFTAGSNAGFGSLNSVEGTVDLYGQSFTITPGSGTLTIGSSGQLGASFNPNNSVASSITIAGSVDNSGDLGTGFNSNTGGNSLEITGNVTNESSGTFALFGSGDLATVGGSLDNSGSVELGASGSHLSVGAGLTSDGGGFIDVENGSTLAITGNVTNSSGGSFQGINTDYFGRGGGNTITISGMLTNSGSLQLLGPGDMATLGSLTNNAGGLVDVENASTLNITGDVTNSGALETGVLGVGGNTVTISGMVTNSGSEGIALVGPGDMMTIGGDLVNSAMAYAANGSTLQINGNASNAAGGFLGTDLDGAFGGGNTLNIAGSLTNNGNFGVLGAGDMAMIGNGVTNNSGGIVDIENSSTLNITGDVTNSGAFETNEYGFGGNNTLMITGNLTNNGGFSLTGPGDQGTITGNVMNSGTLASQNGSTLTIEGNLNNSGLADADQGGTLQIDGTVTNSGTLATNDFGYGGGNTITVSGLLTNTPTGIITLNGSMDTLQAFAGIVNSGTINVNNSSAIDPPFFNNLGTLNIDSTSKFVVGTGNPGGTGYIQLGNGTLGEMISATNFGVINVSGSALLAGTLDILLQGGFDPSVGSTYKFLLADAGEINGMFSNIENDIFNGGTEKWDVTYDSADGYVELTAENNGTPVPEPASLLVLIPALLGASFGLRRQLFR